MFDRKDVQTVLDAAERAESWGEYGVADGLKRVAKKLCNSLGATNLGAEDTSDKADFGSSGPSENEKALADKADV